jgi:hypothetical protein
MTTVATEAQAGAWKVVVSSGPREWAVGSIEPMGRVGQVISSSLRRSEWCIGVKSIFSIPGVRAAEPPSVIQRWCRGDECMSIARPAPHDNTPQNDDSDELRAGKMRTILTYNRRGC